MSKSENGNAFASSAWLGIAREQHKSASDNRTPAYDQTAFCVGFIAAVKYVSQPHCPNCKGDVRYEKLFSDGGGHIWCLNDNCAWYGSWPHGSWPKGPKQQAASSLASGIGSDASTKPEMSDEELANKLLCVLTQEMIRKADLFDYLCWLEENEQRERVPGALFLVLASDGRTCWGKSYAAAVAGAMKYDAKPYGEHQNGPS